MRNIPFYSNRKGEKEAENSCMLACLKSAFEYLTGRPYSWQQLEELTGYKPEQAAWTVKVWAEVSDIFDIRMIEGFDYKKYFDQGETYLYTFLKPQEVKWHLKNSNLAQIRPLIPDFLQKVEYQKRSPQLEDVDEMLSQGYLVTVQLNSSLLNDESGYEAHMILVHDKSGKDYIAHDPGPPGEAYRRIPSEKLFAAMGGDDNTVEVTGIKLKLPHEN